MSYVDQTAPSLPDFYKTGLLASALAYLGILALVAISMAADTGSPQAAFSVFFIGGAYTILPAILIALLITAPLGCAIGIAMLKLFEPGPWQGAANGAFTAMIVIMALVLIAEGAPAQAPDTGTIVFVLGLLAIGAASGWAAQRTCINWPETNSAA